MASLHPRISGYRRDISSKALLLSLKLADPFVEVGGPHQAQRAELKVSWIRYIIRLEGNSRDSPRLWKMGLGKKISQKKLIMIQNNKHSYKLDPINIS